MESWVYVFSRFTQEALLFEALLMFIGFAAYAAFFITRRRKYGAAGQEIPSNLVKVYLAQLVADAEEMRNQLFGLLGKGSADGKLFNINIVNEAAKLQAAAGATVAPADPEDGKVTVAPATAIVQDPSLQQKLKELESKMSEQAKALDAVLNEKMRLEEELAVARAKTGAPGEAGADDQSEQLTEKLKTLEAQLAEYAVIEDDLANLKRLQKENKTLRQQLEEAQSKGAATAAPAATAPTAAATPAAAPAAKSEASTPDAPAAEAKPAAAEAKSDVAPTEAASAAPAAEAAPAETPASAKSTDSAVAAAEKPVEPNVDASLRKAAAPETPVDAAAGEAAPNFDALVDQVEKSLAQTDTPAETEAKASADSANPEAKASATPEAKASESPAPTEGKSEEELQADFERMLKS